jgi:hypothetical protein
LLTGSAQDLIAAIGIVYFERRFILVLFVYAFSYIILYVARQLVASSSSLSRAFVLALANASSIALALGICALALRWIAVHRARQLVSGDKERYDVMWQSMMQVDDYREKIGAIQDEVTQSANQCPPQ